MLSRDLDPFQKETPGTSAPAEITSLRKKIGAVALGSFAPSKAGQMYLESPLPLETRVMTPEFWAMTPKFGVMAPKFWVMTP